MSDQSPNNDSLGLDESVRERLVAYLDGELSDKESQAIERQLSSDNNLRSELQGLDQAWNALDALPVETAGNDFTKSTIAMVVQDVQQQSAVKGSSRLAPRLNIGQIGRYFAYACLIAVGFLTAVMFSSYRDRQLLINLPEILHAHTLSQVGDIDFLKAWSERSGKLTNVLLTDSVKEDSSTWSSLQDMPLPGRYRWVDGLPPEQLAELSDEKRSFQTLSDSRKEQLRALSSAISESSNPQQLREDALLYQSFVSRLPATEQVILRELPSEERIERVMKELKRSQRSMKMELSEPEKRIFRDAIGSTVGLIQASNGFSQNRFISQMIQSRFGKGSIQDLTESQMAHRRLGFVIMVSAAPEQKVDSTFGKPGAMIAERIRRGWEEELMPVLLDGLPDRVSRYILSQKDLSRQTKLLGFLVQQTIRSTTNMDASTYFAEELSRQEQLQYLAMPIDQMQEELNDRVAAETIGGLPPLERLDPSRGLPPEFQGFGPPSRQRRGPDADASRRPQGRPDEFLDGPPPRGRGPGPGPRFPPPPQQ